MLPPTRGAQRIEGREVGGHLPQFPSYLRHLVLKPRNLFPQHPDLVQATGLLVVRREKFVRCLWPSIAVANRLARRCKTKAQTPTPARQDHLQLATSQRGGIVPDHVDVRQGTQNKKI